jgi:hypothetical protein
VLATIVIALYWRTYVTYKVAAETPKMPLAVAFMWESATWFPLSRWLSRPDPSIPRVTPMLLLARIELLLHPLQGRDFLPNRLQLLLGSPALQSTMNPLLIIVALPGSLFSRQRFSAQRQVYPRP